MGIGLFTFNIAERRKFDKIKKAYEMLLDTLDRDSFKKYELQRLLYGPPPTKYRDKDSVNRILDTLDNDNDNDVKIIHIKKTGK